MNFLMFEDLKPDWTSDCRQAYEGLNRRTDDLNQQNVEMFCFSSFDVRCGINNNNNDN